MLRASAPTSIDKAAATCNSERNRSLRMSREVERIFADEARRRILRVESLVEGGIPAPGTPERQELWRHVHSLKGTAESLGFLRIGELSGDIAERLGGGHEATPGSRELEAGEAEVVLQEVAELEHAVQTL